MPSTRRAILKRGVPCVLGAIAGCTANDGGSDRHSTELTSARSTQTTRKESTMKTTTKEPGRSAVTLTHRKQLIDESVRNVSTRYYSRIFKDRNSIRSIDISNVRDDFPEQDISPVEQFISGTDLEQTSILAVQSEIPSPNYELEFDFLSRSGGVTQTIARLSEGELEGSEPAVSTMFVKIPTSRADNVEVTLVDVVGAYTSDPLHEVTTFLPPNKTLFESLNVGPSNNPVSQKIGVPGGALLTNPDVASRFASEDKSYSSFIRRTDFDNSYVLAVQATMPNSGYYMIPQTVTSDNDRVTARIRQQNFGGGLNAEFTHLLLTRVPDSSPPENGTATIRTYDFDESLLDKQSIELASTPNEWSDS